MICPICHRVFELEQSTALPFCSSRCRQIDLGRWLGEGYRIATDPEDDDELDAGELDAGELDE